MPLNISFRTATKELLNKLNFKLKNMKTLKINAAFLLLLFFITPFVINAQLSKANLIPKPLKITDGKGFFKLNKKTIIYWKSASNDGKNLANYLASVLKPATGFPLKIKKAKNLNEKNVIYVIIKNKPELGKEAYHLKADKDKVVICANNPAGIFYGIQTLRQILPAQIEAKTK